MDKKYEDTMEIRRILYGRRNFSKLVWKGKIIYGRNRKYKWK